MIDFDRYLKRIPGHSVELPDESRIPIHHHRWSANAAWNLLNYFQRNIERVDVYRKSFDRHIHHLATMVLLGLVESFERFLKEVAAECVNHVAPCVLDDRLDVFSSRGNVVAAHFQGRNLGRVLCEPLPWCDCDETNKRYRRILADPFDGGNFYIFPRDAKQGPASLRGRYELMEMVWQLRHSIAHNMGVLTSSDAFKLRLITKRDVPSPRLIWPEISDVWYVKLFLDEAARSINAAVAARLAELLTTLHGSDPALFRPEIKAQELADLFQVPCEVGGIMKSPSP